MADFEVSPNYKGKHPKSPEELEEARKTRVPNNVIRHRELCRDLNNIYAAKNKAYGNSFGDTFDKLGLISAVTRITDKYNRLVNLAAHPEDEKLVSDESLRDTLLDMSNYCLMTILEIDKRDGKKSGSVH